jgi:hypothetical protein
MNFVFDFVLCDNGSFIKVLLCSPLPSADAKQDVSGNNCAPIIMFTILAVIMSISIIFFQFLILNLVTKFRTEYDII